MPRSKRTEQAARRIEWGAMRAALTLVCGFDATVARAAVCPTKGAESVVLSTIEPRLELRLADGRLIRLVGLDAATATKGDPTLAETTRAALTASLKGRALSIVPLATRSDRWGRIPAWVFATDGATPGGVATAALAEGLARYRPEPDAAPCRADLLSAEAAARGARLGLWRDPYYRVLAVDDRIGLAERAGTDVLVEARLVAVEPGPYRIRLRFAAPTSANSGGTLEATIVSRAMKTFEAEGVDFSSLIGRTLRLRGLLDERFGPRIELARPDEIEVLPPPGAGPPSGPE